MSEQHEVILDSNVSLLISKEDCHKESFNFVVEQKASHAEIQCGTACCSCMSICTCVGQCRKT